jgi:hypothetical protein
MRLQLFNIDGLHILNSVRELRKQQQILKILSKINHLTIQPFYQIVSSIQYPAPSIPIANVNISPSEIKNWFKIKYCGLNPAATSVSNGVKFGVILAVWTY